MKASVYDFNNDAKIIDLPDIDSILSISVDIVTGDEIVHAQLMIGGINFVIMINTKTAAEISAAVIIL